MSEEYLKEIVLENIDIDKIAERISDYMLRNPVVRDDILGSVITDICFEDVKQVPMWLGPSTIEKVIKILIDLEVVQKNINYYAMNYSGLMALTKMYNGKERVLVYLDKKNIPLWFCPESKIRTYISCINSGDAHSFVVFDKESSVVQSGRVLLKGYNGKYCGPRIKFNMTLRMERGKRHIFAGKNFNRLIAQSAEDQQGQEVFKEYEFSPAAAG